MDRANNGPPPAGELPGIIVQWDDARQIVAGLEFDVKVFRSWPFTIAVLRMAVETAETAFRQSQAVSQQNQRRILRPGMP